MPIYEYRCPKGHTFERFQSMTAPAPEKCDVCSATPLEIVLYPVAVHYKGSGFYSTDYGKKGAAAAKKDGGESGGSSSGDSGGAAGVFFESPLLPHATASAAMSIARVMSQSSVVWRCVYMVVPREEYWLARRRGSPTKAPTRVAQRRSTLGPRRRPEQLY